MEQQKLCCRCRVVKRVGDFHRKRIAPGGRNSFCKDCDRARYQAHRPARLATSREGLRRRRARPEYLEKERAYRNRSRDRMNAYCRAYRQRDLEKWRAYGREWRRAHLDADRAKSAKRRAIVASCEGRYTAAEWTALKARYDHRCLCCARRESEVKLQADHVVPITRGGRNDISNLQPLCKPCNQKKRQRVIDYRPGATRAVPAGAAA